jgi:hypothetical protein
MMLFIGKASQVVFSRGIGRRDARQPEPVVHKISSETLDITNLPLSDHSWDFFFAGSTDHGHAKSL